MPRCKNCSDKFEPARFNMKYCLKDECVRVFVEEVKNKTWKKTKAKAKLDLMTLSDYLKLAQQVFNKFIRLRDKGQPCISCNAKAGSYTITAGHYFPSTNKSVTFNEDNLHGQCWYNCNSSKSGNLAEYRLGLIQRIGLERIEKLELESRKTKKWTQEELKEIIAIYKKKIKEIELY
jgi:hypothetical protein